MNYQQIYNSIISNALRANRVKTKEIYYEKHHIIPKFMGGLDDKNTVLLTAREHFICHHLLTKFVPSQFKSKAAYAFWAMCNQLKGDVKRDYKVSSKVYSYAKLQFSLHNSKRHKGKTMPKEWVEKLRIRMKNNNPNKGKIGILNPLFKKSRPKEVTFSIRKSKIVSKLSKSKGVFITPMVPLDCLLTLVELTI